MDWTLLGKQIDKLPKTMDLSTEKGSKVSFLGRGGFDHEENEACKLFEVGEILTVESLSVGNWSSTVTFKEHPNKKFNTVMFSNID